MQSRFYNPACRACGNAIPTGTEITRNAAGQWVHFRCPPRVAAAPRQSAPADWTPRNLIADEVGSYVAISDPDTVYHVVETRDHQRYYAERFVLIGGARTTEAGTVLNGDWQYETTRANGTTERYSRLVARLLDQGKLRRMTADEVIDFATLYGRCVQHGGFLKSAVSVDAGIGPICAKKLGMSTADLKAAAAAARERRAALHGTPPTSAAASFTRKAAPKAAPAPAAPARPEPAAPAPAPLAPPAGPVRPGSPDFEARYAALFGDEPSAPAAPSALRPISDEEQTAARQRWASSQLPTDGFTVRRSRYVRRAPRGLSRWSRPSDDDLGHAAGYGRDEY